MGEHKKDRRQPLVEMKVRRRFLRLRAVIECTGYRRTRLYELIASGEFPKPVKLSSTGHAVAWNEDEVTAWQEARLAARDAKVA